LDTIDSCEDTGGEPQCLLSFWAFGDLHYRAREKWHAIHSHRLTPLFQDVRSLWAIEGPPDFTVSPGDIVQTGTPENYRLAQQVLAAQLGSILFYPGIGNHEYHREHSEDTLHTAEDFCRAWGKPVRYAWIAGGLTCIMLDHPNPYVHDDFHEDSQVMLAQESLTFLESTLREHSDQPAIIFSHCPLHNTVRDRDPARNLDNDSQDPGFYVENSHEVRAILSGHRKGVLYISGHTHSGWESPHLIFTEILGGTPVTHVNLMSPWYTGRHHGPRRINGPEKFTYEPDNPDMLLSYAFSIYPSHAIIQVRDHIAKRWLARWQIPLTPKRGIIEL